MDFCEARDKAAETKLGSPAAAGLVCLNRSISRRYSSMGLRLYRLGQHLRLLYQTLGERRCVVQRKEAFVFRSSD